MSAQPQRSDLDVLRSPTRPRDELSARERMRKARLREAWWKLKDDLTSFEAPGPQRTGSDDETDGPARAAAFILGAGRR